MMSDFQAFIFYTFPFFLGGIVIRIVCWTIGCGLDFIHKGVGGDDDI